MSWGSGSPKNGKAVAPTTTVAIVPGTNDGHFTFAKSVRPCIVSNKSGQIAHVTINDPDFATCSDAAHHISLANGDWAEVSFGGALNVKYLTVEIAASGDETKFEIWGWDANS